jgi:Domain of unknown function (DUF4157)
VQMNRSLGAQAFTHGSDIYYGAGKSPANSDLTAHELTHVVQQTGGIQAKESVQRECAECAECAEEDTVQRSIDISSTSQSKIQRWFGDDEETESESSVNGGIVDWVKEKASGAANAVVETGGAVVDWAKEKGSAAVETVTQVGSRIIDSTTQKGDEVVETATQVGGEIIDWANQTGNDLADSTTKTLSGAFGVENMPDTKNFLPIVALGFIPEVRNCIGKVSPSKLWEISKVVSEKGWNGLIHNQDTIEIACACLPDEYAPELARFIMFKYGGLASQHLDHYLTGGGADYYEDLHKFLTEDTYVNQKLREGLLAKGIQGSQDIQQRDYLIQEYRNSFGAMNLNFWINDSPQAKELNKANPGTASVHVEMRDLYQWHPQEPRITQCLHKILESLKSQGAKDFWMVGSTDISLELPLEMIPQ